MSVINLNKARKARAKAQAKTTAARNRVAFGRTRLEKELAASRAGKAARELDGKNRGDSEES